MKVFISFASEDRDFAERIHLALLGDGYETFYDQHSLPPGQDYHARIRRAVESSDVFVFLVSPDSIVAGSYALTELEYARRKWPHPKAAVLPVRIRGIEWDTIPNYLASVTVLSPSGDLAAEVLGAVTELRRRWWRSRGIAGGMVAGLVAASGVLLWLQPPMLFSGQIAALPILPVEFGTRLVAGSFELAPSGVPITGLTVINPDTGEITPLTSGFDPAVSSDGTRLVVSRYTAQYTTDLFTMKIDGNDVRRITNGPGHNEEPSWSPDGSRIAFTTSRDGDYNYEIYVVNADGRGLVRLTNNNLNDYHPVWSPDGRRIAFHRYFGDLAHSEIMVMNADGSGEVRLTNDGTADYTPAWSPDGRTIAFSRDADGGSEIFTVGANGRRMSRLTNNAFPDTGPVWSPDGTRIAFISDRGTPAAPRSDMDIYIMNADGSGPVPLTNDAKGYRRVFWFRALPPKSQ